MFGLGSYVWLRLVLAMDGQQEPVRYKAINYLDKKVIRCQLSLLTFSTGLEKVKSLTGRKHCKQNSNRLDERRRAITQKNPEVQLLPFT